MTLLRMQPDKTIHLSSRNEKIVHGNVQLRKMR